MFAKMLKTDSELLYNLRCPTFNSTCGERSLFAKDEQNPLVSYVMYSQCQKLQIESSEMLDIILQLAIPYGCKNALL